MELRHLRYAMAVADELHFGRAAAALYLSQPSLSAQIQQLENELGVRLFHRTKRRVTLTEPGRLFLERAKVILEEAEQATKLARLAGQGQIGQITVGFLEPAILTFLPGALQAFRAEHPHVHLTLLQLSSIEQVHALRASRIDLGLLRSLAVESDIELTPLLRRAWLAALPSSHPLANEAVLALSDLAGESFILPPDQRRFGAYDEFVRLCNEAGFEPGIIEEASGTLTILGLVAGGMGVGLISQSAARITFPNVILRPVTPSLPVEELAVAVRRNESSPATLAFQRVLLDCVHEYNC